jgi:RNA polymerase sigma factor (sigma-70 family)
MALNNNLRGQAMSSDNENLILLLQQLRQGSEQAFTILYDKFSTPIYRNILHLVKNEDIAQELLQDLFLKIWEIRQNIKLEDSFKSFLYTVAGNMVYTHFRKTAKDNILIAQLVSSYVDYETAAEETFLSQQNLDLLKLAIEKLSPQRKQIYTLCKIEGKSYEEVSNELGISTSTIRDHIVKGNKTIKRFFLANTDIAILFIASQLINYKNSLGLSQFFCDFSFFNEPLF